MAAKNSLMRDVLSLFLKIAAIAAVILLLFTFIFGIFQYRETGMKPSIKDGDLVIFYRLDKTYVASDTLVLKYQGQQQIRRVVAIAGDVVDITESGLTINGALIMEDTVSGNTIRYEGGIDFPVTVGEDEVFVLGDSREQATDSRVYGSVKIRDTMGKVMTIIRRRGI